MTAHGSPKPVAAILIDVERLTSSTIAQIISESQRANLVRLRDAVAWVAWTAHGLSNAHIGLALGNREQTTIRAAINRATARRESDLDFVCLTNTLLAAADERRLA